LRGAGFLLAPRIVRYADALRRRKQKSSAPLFGQSNHAALNLGDHG
jgi:hypothetical protein